LLFASTPIFENPTIDDCIRQSLIDIIGEPPPDEELIPVFEAGLQLLTISIQHATFQNLISLLSRIYSKSRAVEPCFKLSSKRPLRQFS
jgi:hypothetical protein